MPPSALLILIIAALLHTAWNLLLKNSENKYIILWWGLAIGAVICLPVLILKIPITISIWPFAIASALFETIYYVLLATAYQKDDFSLVYPIARGAAPALLAIWAVLFLKESLSDIGKIGLVILICGLILVGSSKLWTVREKGIGSVAGIGLACLVALIISVYSVIDGAAVQQTGAPAYTVLVFILTALLALPLVFRRYGWHMVISEGRAHWMQAAIIGILSLLAYMLVLVTYSFIPVSYGGAIREISIIFGALAGWLLLKEKFGPVRLIGAAIIFAGILTIVVAG